MLQPQLTARTTLLIATLVLIAPTGVTGQSARATAPPRPPAPAAATVPPSQPVPSRPQATPGARASAPAAHDWIFARGLYTNDAKTGQRVSQYRSLPRVYRVPNDEYFAPNGPHPYGPEYGGWYFGGEPYLTPGFAPYYGHPLYLPPLLNPHLPGLSMPAFGF